MVNPAFAVIRPVEVNVPAPVRFAPLPVRAVVPPGARTISPVLVSPKVKVCLLLVARTPEAER